MNSHRTKPFLHNNVAPALGKGIGLVVFLFIFTIMIHTALQGIVLGADLYTFWLAEKAMLLEQQSPYSSEVTLQKQLALYGRPALPEEDQVAFAYPPYILLILIPILWLSFDWAYSFWLALNIIGFLSLLFVLFRPPNRSLLLTAILFYPVFLCLMVGNFAVMLTGVLLLFFGIIAHRRNYSPLAQIVMAIMLAWATAKPQFMWLFTIFILLFALKQRLFIFLITFGTSLIAMLAISFAYVPGWVTEWLVRIQEYAGYVRSQPVLSELLQAFMPEQVAIPMTGFIFLIFAGLTVWFFILWWNFRMDWLPVFAWIGLVTYLFHLHGIAYEQMVFLAPFILWSGIQDHWKVKTTLIIWSGILLVSWLAFAGGRVIPSDELRLAADRSTVLFVGIWVVWLLFTNPKKSHEPRGHEISTTRMAPQDNFQV